MSQSGNILIHRSDDVVQVFVFRDQGNTQAKLSRFIPERMRRMRRLLGVIISRTAIGFQERVIELKERRPSFGNDLSRAIMAVFDSVTCDAMLTPSGWRLMSQVMYFDPTWTRCGRRRQSNRGLGTRTLSGFISAVCQRSSRSILVFKLDSPPHNCCHNCCFVPYVGFPKDLQPGPHRSNISPTRYTGTNLWRRICNIRT